MIPSGSPLEGRMIFLVGARRSGTNWLQRIVGAHPEVAIVPSETYLFSRGIKPLRERFHQGVLGSPGTAHVYMDRAAMTAALRSMCDQVFLPFLEASGGRTRVAERTPEHVTCLDLIGEVYPDASVVHIIRDGRDVARSLLSQTWGTAPGSMAEAADEWRSCVEAGERTGRDLARYRSVRYEAMLADPRPNVTELYAWLGLDTSDAVVEAALTEAGVAFNADPGAPSVGTGKWRGSFTDEDLAAFLSVAGETLARLGYETDGGGSPEPQAEPTRPKRPASRLRRAKGSSEDGDRAEMQRFVIAQATNNQRLMDRVVGAITARRLERLPELSLPAVWVRVVGPEGAWKGRGEAAFEKLLETIRSDDALDGRQIEGDLHAGVPTSTAVMTFQTADGSLHLRVVALSAQQDRIDRIVYYRFPVVR